VNVQDAALSQLAVYLAGQRDSILRAWRCAVDADPELKTASMITRAQFVDHIPAVLDAFERRLSAQVVTERALAREEQRDSAAEHGLHRWQQGYNQPETMGEWRHLHLCLLQELEGFQERTPGVDSAAMRSARRELVRLCSDGMCASASRYAQLQQGEAASRVRELESALDQLRELEQQRAEAWREAAHDLRGRVHAIASASKVLTGDGVPEQQRAPFSEMLRLGVQSLNRLLGDLMDHARLEAGQERRQVTRCDVAQLLKEFCETIRPMAAEKGLFLVARGTAPFWVEGDPAKIQRILQNLLLNALKVTDRGGVEVSWWATDDLRRPQWVLCVQDTGPGFRGGSATPLERVLKRATDEAHEVEQRDAAPTLASQTSTTPQPAPEGEGIGLSIVKRLCELLDATIELESPSGKGTTFRVTFPVRYPDSPGDS
jgi:signal transduction histidine kinase